jgi:hypothetical protein
MDTTIFDPNWWTGFHTLCAICVILFCYWFFKVGFK